MRSKMHCNYSADEEIIEKRDVWGCFTPPHIPFFGFLWPRLNSYDALYDSVIDGKHAEVVRLTQQGLGTGLAAEELLYDALIPALEEVGALFESGEFFVPEMLVGAKAMKAGLNLLRPLLAQSGTKPVGKFLILTAKGDVHDIGKDLVRVMLEGAGFQAIDLGVDVAPEKMLAAIEEHQPQIVGFSAFLTTTMPMFKTNIELLKEAGVGGGYVCSSSNMIHSGVDPELYKVMIATIHHYGQYPLDMDMLAPV